MEYHIQPTVDRGNFIVVTDALLNQNDPESAAKVSARLDEIESGELRVEPPLPARLFVEYREWASRIIEAT